MKNKRFIKTFAERLNEHEFHTRKDTNNSKKGQWPGKDEFKLGPPSAEAEISTWDGNLKTIRGNTIMWFDSSKYVDDSVYTEILAIGMNSGYSVIPIPLGVEIPAISDRFAQMKYIK